jgi:hypothetical protein
MNLFQSGGRALEWKRRNDLVKSGRRQRKRGVRRESGLGVAEMGRGFFIGRSVIDRGV